MLFCTVSMFSWHPALEKLLEDSPAKLFFLCEL
jgi:hypothetical protein